MNVICLSVCLSVCSLMEVYNDYVIDLLSFGTTLRTPLRVSEHPKTGPHVQGKTTLSALVLQPIVVSIIARLFRAGVKSLTWVARETR